MRKKDKLLNYTLSVAFILLIVIFLTSIISISRYVLSDGTAIQEHVVSTKTLLEDIERVEKTVEDQEKAEKNMLPSVSRSEKITNFENNIDQIAYLNINENKSILTFTLNKTIKKLNGIYYLEYINQSYIEKNNIILYNVKERGVVLTNKEKIEVFNFESNEAEEIEFGNILGKIIYEEENDEN